MKKNYKILSLLIILLIPLIVSAKSENANQGYCNRVSNAYQKLIQRIDNLDEKLEQKRNQIVARLEERRQQRDTRFTKKREKWDANREKHFALLEEKAGTEEQKQALLKFKQIVSQAIIDRRQAVDQAINDFREGVEDLKLARWDDIDEMIANYRDELKLAFENANNECGKGSDQGDISQSLKNQLRNTKQGFLDNKATVGNIREGMQELIEAKKQAIQQAKDDFKETINQALEDLKLVFPEVEE